MSTTTPTAVAEQPDEQLLGRIHLEPQPEVDERDTGGGDAGKPPRPRPRHGRGRGRREPNPALALRLLAAFLLCAGALALLMSYRVRSD